MEILIRHEDGRLEGDSPPDSYRGGDIFRFI